MIHKRYYAVAQKEVEEERMDGALWVKAQAEASNPTQTYQLYLRLRAAELAQEGIKDRVRDCWAKGVEVWKGERSSSVPATQQGTNPWLVVLAFGLVAMAIYAVYVAVNENNSTPGMAAPPSRASSIEPSRYLLRDTHAMDFDGIALGMDSVKVERIWPGLTCSVLAGRKRACQGENRGGKVAKVPIQGNIVLLVNGNGTLYGAIVVSTSTSVEALKSSYDELWGPSVWIEASEQSGAAGWIWHHGGLTLKVCSGSEPNEVDVSLLLDSR